MTDWTSGYVADIAYTYGYFSELSPLRATLALLDRGLAPPPEGPCCELGFGQGISANFHAAASGTAWWGTDFNPAQAAFAQGLAQSSGAEARLFDESFAEFCGRTDLPDFAFIGLHGIWSWISDDNRRLIVDFVRRKLKVGGVLYMGYNAQPGWAAFAPVRNLLAQFGETMVPAGVGSVERVEQSLAFAGKLFALNPLFGRLNPIVGDRLAGLQTKNRPYLAHEYFNGHWQPMAFDEVARWLAPAKMEYAASAMFADHIDDMNLTADQQAFLAAIPDATLRETARDFCINRQFRKDYWVKGAEPLEAFTQMSLLRQQRVVLAKHPKDISASFNSVLGEIALDEALLQAFVQALADHRPATLAELDAVMAPRGMTFPQLLQTVMLLVGRNELELARSEQAAAQARPFTDRLNTRILDLAPISAKDVPFLASPVTGGGVTVHRPHQLFLLAVRQGKATPGDIVEFLQGLFVSAGLRMGGPDGTPESPEESAQRLRGEAEVFLADTLPALRALGVA